MHILGLNSSIDAAACIIDKDKIVAAVSEERFARVKHIRCFPSQSMQFCLNKANKKISDINAIAVCWNPGIHLENLSSLKVKNNRHYSELLMQIPYNILIELQISQSNINSRVSFIKQTFEFEKNTSPIDVYYLNHHLSHAASAYFMSPFKNSAILTIDGYGEESSILMAKGEEGRIIPIEEIFFPHSIGSIYAAITQYLGFIPNNDEGKVMGLAAWGKPVYYAKLKKIINFKNTLEVDLSYFSYYMERKYRISRKFIKEFGRPRYSNEVITQRHKNIAASLQKIVEEIILSLAEYLYKKTKSKNLCFAGGVALNCASNGLLYNNTSFKNVFVPSFPSDDGNSVGAALYLKHVILKYPRNDYNEKVYLGPEYNDKYVEAMLKRNKIKYIKCNNPAKKAAEFISQNKIIGWFQNRMEFGPRALGNRSILAHPNAVDVKKRLDEEIKLRESFRPYAPSILKEKYKIYFKKNYESPYMSFCSKAALSGKDKLKNVIHKDGTARVQTVDKNVNPLFYSLIKEFEKITKIPIVLNTSFNPRGEPIVNKPEEAVSMFFNSGLDALFMGDLLIVKK